MSFLRNYTDWTSGTEVPENYSFWAGVSAVAALLQGKVWTRMGRFVIYPNLYVIFLGPPGNGKTVAKDNGLKIIRSVGDVKFSAEAQTKESVVRFMREDCVQSYPWKGETVLCTPISIYLTELSHFLGPNFSHMLDFLTTIWDRTGDVYDARTKNKGDDILPAPYVNLLACTTPDWIQTYLKSDIITGGFTRRAIFVNEPATDDSKRIPRPQWSPEQLTAKENVIAYGRILKGLIGELTWSSDATSWWDHWYLRRPIPNDPDVRGYHKSKPVLLLKVASLLALSQRPEMVIERDHMEAALALLDSTERTLSRVFQGIGRNELNAVASKMMEFIFAQPPIDIKSTAFSGKAHVMNQKDLRAIMYKHAAGREFDEIVAHLVATDKVFRFNETVPPQRTFLCIKSL